MIKICTSIEQSKKLLSFGLDPGTADMYYCAWIKPSLFVGSYERANFINGDDKAVPAWSLEALLNLMPAIIRNCQLTVDKEKGDVYNISYDGILSKEIIILYADYYLINAAFKMVCWLIEQGHIKTKNIT